MVLNLVVSNIIRTIVLTLKTNNMRKFITILALTLSLTASAQLNHYALQLKESVNVKIFETIKFKAMSDKDNENNPEYIIQDINELCLAYYKIKEYDLKSFSPSESQLIFNSYKEAKSKTISVDGVFFVDYWAIYTTIRLIVQRRELYN